MEAIGTLFRGSNRELALMVVETIHRLSEYWPVTVRQVYYQLVAALAIQNTLGEYKRISKMVTTLRRESLLPWEAVEDRTRRTTDKRGVCDLRTFVAEQSEWFLNWQSYHRCRVQNQAAYVEVAIEKDSLLPIMEEAVWPYCVRLKVVRGQVSATMVNAMAAVDV